MKKLLFTAIAATMFFAACSPTGVELAKPETPKTEEPQKDPVKVEPSEANDYNNNKYWLLYKTGKYELYNRETKKVGQFLIDDAERLLRMPGTVWEIEPGAPYVFSFGVGLGFNKNLIK
jgi:protein involved in sex pheromone biosynthesis